MVLLPLSAAQFTQDQLAWWSTSRAPTGRAEAGAGWTANEIDHFIARKSAEQKLTRRSGRKRVYPAHADLTGLPPTPEQVTAFLKILAECLANWSTALASPRYGERQASFWLDLVRYADSDGYRADHRPEAGAIATTSSTLSADRRMTGLCASNWPATRLVGQRVSWCHHVHAPLDLRTQPARRGVSMGRCSPM